MSTDLAGGTVTETFSTTGGDLNAPYTNSSSDDATVHLVVDAGVRVEEFQAIDQTAGAISLDLSGPGTVLLEGNDVYSGGTLLSGGVLQFTGASSLGTGGVEFVKTAALVALFSSTLDDLIDVNAGASATFDSDDDLTLSGTLLFDGGARTTVHFTAVDDGATDLAPIAASADPAGAIAVDSGVLIVGNSQAASLIGAMHGGLTVGSGVATATLDLHDNSLTAFDLGGDASGVISDSVAGPCTLTVDDSVPTTFAGVIENGHGSVALTVDDEAGKTFTLTGADTFTGGTTIDAGGALQLGDGGTTGSIVGDVTDNGTLAFDHSDDVTFAGNISGAGAVELLGTGQTTLAGNNNYSGGTTIDAGALAIGAATALGTGGLKFAGADALIATAGFNLANPIDVAKGVTATIAEADDNASLALDSTGAIDFNGGAGSTLNFGSATDTGAVYLTPDGTEAVAADSTLAVNGGFLLPGNAAGATMIGQFAFTIIGTGATDALFDLNGEATTLNNLTGDGSGTIQNFGAAHATLTLNNTSSSSFSGNIHNGSGGLSVVVTGSGKTLTFAGANSYTGGTAIDSGGVLRLGDGGTGGSILDNVTDHGELIFDHSNNVAFAGMISGAGSVEVLGTGITTLSGDNTSFKGPVTLLAGTLDLASASAAGHGLISLTGPSVELRAEKGDIPHNEIAGLAAGDSIDLVGVTANSASVNASDQLVVKNGATPVARLLLSGANGGLTFSTLTNTTGTLVYVDANVAQYASRKGKLDLAPDGFALVGTAAALTANIGQFGADAKVALVIVSDNAPLQLTALQAAAGAHAVARLRNANGSVGTVAIAGSAANIEASLGALASLASHVASIAFSDKTPPTLSLTAAQATTDAALLSRITGSWILDVHNANGSWTTTGHGNALTIVDIAGEDTITGGGTNEAFVFNHDFGEATLVDFQSHLTGSTHDTVTLAKADFGANVHALLGDASVVKGGLMLSTGGDHLLLDGMTKLQLSAAIAAGDFKLA